MPRVIQLRALKDVSVPTGNVVRLAPPNANRIALMIENDDSANFIRLCGPLDDGTTGAKLKAGGVQLLGLNEGAMGSIYARANTGAVTVTLSEIQYVDQV